MMYFLTYASIHHPLCSPRSVVAPVLRLDVGLLLWRLLLVLRLLTQAGIAVSEAQGWTWGVSILAVRGPS